MHDLPGVSRTAVWLAALRAREAQRADRLFDEPLAAAFVRAAGGGMEAETAGVPEGASEFLAIRTRWFDDQGLAACSAGARQVVLLAAGLDSRAFRLEWPDGVRLFELDLPELFAFKEPVLASSGITARCDRTAVGVDLRGDWTPALTAAGFDPGAATAWLVEGLVPYLDAEGAAELLDAVTGLSAPGSVLAFDYLDAAAADRAGVRATAEAIQRMGATINLTADDPARRLAAHGWDARTELVPELGVAYGRPLPAVVDTAASNATILTRAIR
jgi:methyltransferase (TIGR00027 family)